MDRKISTLFKKAGFVIAALFACWTVQAQSTTNTATPTDTTHHHYGMHRGWGHRPGGDSLSNVGGFRGHGGQYGIARGFGPDGRDRFNHGAHGGWANHRPGGRNPIHYTPDQRKQVAAINKDYRQKAEDLFKQDNIMLKQYKSSLIALQKEKKDKLSALLTQEQKDQLAASKKRRDENRQVMQAAHLERLKLRLNLTDEQVAKINADQENLHSQAKAIHENDNLLPQEKREQMKALLAKRNDTYKAVLTPDQYSQFEKMHEHGGFGRPGGFGRGRFGGDPDGHRPDGPGAI